MKKHLFSLDSGFAFNTSVQNEDQAFSGQSTSSSHAYPLKITSSSYVTPLNVPVLSSYRSSTSNAIATTFSQQNLTWYVKSLRVQFLTSIVLVIAFGLFILALSPVIQSWRYRYTCHRFSIYLKHHL